MQRSTLRAGGALALAAALSLIVSGCVAGAGEEPTEAAPLTYRDAEGACAADANAGVDLAAAEEFLDPFLTGPDGIFLTEALAEPVSPDTTVAFLNNGTVIAGLMQSFAQAAAETAGVHFQNVDTGTGADTINSALNSVVESQPDIVISAALDATFFQDQLAQLEAAGTTFVYVGAVNGDEFGVQDSVGGKGASEVNGRVLAASAVYFTCGTGTEFTFYHIPEFAFSQVQLESATEYLAELCADCNLRPVDISITEPSPSDKIVSDLQAHPESQFFVTTGDQFQIGLAQKAELAGIENAVGIGHSTIAPNIGQIAAGEQTAGFAVDYNQYIWVALDEGFRRSQGDSAAYDDWATVVQSMSRVITPSTAGDYTSPAGFIADPDMAAHFAELWG
jgi:ABC-type sugar transport system substrate-binding protein